MIASLIYSIYILIIALANDPVQWELIVLLSLIVITVMAVAFQKKNVAIISNVLSASIVLEMMPLETYYSLAAIISLFVVALPLVAVFESTYVERIEKRGSSLSNKLNRVMAVPAVYVAIIFSIFVFLTQNSLYRMYFVSSGHEFLQLLILISLATILFVPFYARFD